MIILWRGSKIWYALLLTCELYDRQLYGVTVFHLAYVTQLTLWPISVTSVRSQEV